MQIYAYYVMSSRKKTLNDKFNILSEKQCARNFVLLLKYNQLDTYFMDRINCPKFPDDRRIGREIIDCNLDSFFDGFFDEEWSTLDGILPTGKAIVLLHTHGLWVVERAFRISKGTIETRPIFHFTERRIEAHLCLCFVTYKVYKELERIVAELKLEMSVDSVLKIAKTITTILLRLPLNDKVMVKTMMLTPEQRALKPLFDHFGV